MLKITYQVKCPRDHGKIYSVTHSVTTLKNGKYLPSPCNGCEHINGSAKCEHCIQSLFKMSLKDPTMESYKQPIIP